MKTRPTLRLLALATLGPLLAAPALAQDSYWYGGVGVGQSRASLDQERIHANVLGTGLGTSGFELDNRDTSYKLFGGYQYNRYFGIESSILHLGRFGYTANTTPAGTVTGEMRLQGADIDAVATLPISERFSLLGRVGASYLRTRDTFSGNGGAHVTRSESSERKFNAKAGVGLQFEFSRSLFMRAEAESFRASDGMGNHGHVNVYSVSLVMPFGRAPAPSRPMAMAAPYVAPAPAPAPMMAAAPPAAPLVVLVPVAPPPAPLRQRVSFSAESLFGFDQSTLRPEGKTALDTFVNELKGAAFEMIVVEGHTDRLGSVAYNQTLSQERADSVKTYLVDSGHLEARQISSIGVGEGTPVTQAGDCVGNRQTAALVSCLQPDRRVEIEVSGTR